MIPPVVTVHSYNAKPQKTDYSAHVIAQSAFCKNYSFSITDYTPNVDVNLRHHTNINFNALKTKDYEVFSTNYVHMSTNPLGFEKAAIAKFFLMREFMHQYKIQRIFHIDSDVLLYDSVSNFTEWYDHYDFTLTHNHQCGNSFFSLEVIEDLCDKILKFYVDKEKYFWFRDCQIIFEKMTASKLNGGISDMTFLKHYKTRKECNSKFTCGEMSEIIDNMRFDHHIRAKDEDYDMINERRAIEFIDEIPHSFNKKLNTNVKFLTLHFGGAAKEYLHEYLTYNK